MTINNFTRRIYSGAAQCKSRHIRHPKTTECRSKCILHLRYSNMFIITHLCNFWNSFYWKFNSFKKFFLGKKNNKTECTAERAKINFNKKFKFSEIPFCPEKEFKFEGKKEKLGQIDFSIFHFLLWKKKLARAVTMWACFCSSTLKSKFFKLF